MAERIVAWTSRLLNRTWVVLLLLGTLLSTIIYSLQEAGWLNDDSVLSACFLLGILFGYLLARSRFHVVFVVVYSLIISIVISIQSIGKILPTLSDLFSKSFTQLVDEMNLRVVGLSLRISGWVDTLHSGDNIQDTGLFILLMGTILALCAIWLMWAMIRQRKVLNGLLPIGILLAVNVHLSRQPLSNYAVFLFMAFLLIAYTSFKGQHEDWEHRHVDYPDQLGLEWGGVALALAMMVVMVARAAPIFGTTEGWKAISDMVDRWHQETSTTATRLFSGVNPPPPLPDQKPVVYVNTPNLGEIGKPIAQGYETIMWVKISDPPPIPPDIGMNAPYSITRVHYWRSNIFATYNGRGWEPARLSGETTKQAEELEKNPPQGRYYLRQDFQLEAKHGGALFATNDPLQSNNGANLRGVTPDGSQVVEGQVDDYQIISAATHVTANQLASASTNYPATIRAIYLQLPDTLPERVRTLAKRVASGGDPFHKALRIQTYLRENYKYDLSVTSSPPNRDVVDYFLFDAPGGFCSHYASAMAIMLRIQGIPARVVTGYAMGDWSEERQAFHVPASASHAWVEVYFPNYGWVEFEPTANRAAIGYSEEGQMVVSDTQGPLQLNDKKDQAAPYLLGLVAFAGLALLVLPFLLLRTFTTSRQAPVVQVGVLYRRMRRALSWAGLAAVPSVTPDEYLAQYAGRLERYDRLSQALRQTTILYRETIYSPRSPEELRVRKASSLWSQSFGQWANLWFKAFWARLRSRVS